MKFISLSLLTFFLLFSQVLSETFYVNGEIGNDDNDGSSDSKENALKTIKKALTLVTKGDEIIVEGKKSKGGSIIYKEIVRIPAGQYGFSLTGKNHPVIDGNFEPDYVTAKSGIIINGDKISVKGFTVRNFLADQMDPKDVAGAGIVIGFNTSYQLVEDNIIENCNFGIYLDGTTFCEVNNNKISNIKRYNDDDSWYDGTGIMVYPSSFGIEGNSIGLKGGNIINNVDTYGICLGADSLSKSADLSRIDNNTITSSGEGGIALLDVDGIIEVEKNTFTDCKVALIMNGKHYDTFVGSNIFNGSRSDMEIQVNDRYDGALLYDLWKNNDNVFKKTTAAAIVPRKKDVLVNKDVGGAILNNVEKAKKIAGKGLKLEVIEPGDKTDLNKN